MKKLGILFLLCICSCFASAQRQKKVVFIIVDGIAADALEQANPPHIKKLMERGTYLRAYQGGQAGEYSQSPTISAVGYNNVLTGVWYNKHNVPDNDIKDPNYHYPTVFRLLKDAFPAKKIAVFSSWQDNRTKLIGEGLPQTNQIKMDEAFDGLELDTINYPHDEERNFMLAIDQAVTAKAAESIRERAPDLSWVYLEYTDDMGHMYGDSPQYTKAIQNVDNEVGQILTAIEEREKKFNEDWLMLVTTDHGRTEKDGKGHGGQSFRQRSAWILSNRALENSYSKMVYPSVVDILPTITKFMEIPVPVTTLRELDGVPLMGDVTLAAPQVHRLKEHLDISWMPLTQEGTVKIWLSTTNNKKTGSDDNYKLMGTFPLSRKHALISIKDIPSTFYKVVLETPQNTVNRWVKEATVVK
ncbi:alkaline phosphatase family protein [Olivibacter domesticus]|uniref:Type I phosphodiesterase / nucleotide pyrophosphatase n=1 Tax=Olivibacter domesticus TaxID=407022 RepID=A0A1H7W793_OLID1|nr:alkaline phosphatase family protein [Olivibacter domesticus]SEM16858.1 Type I phosphodiesterase / nucleotide pyrophosphatase [Olivibacter domesticus]